MSCKALILYKLLRLFLFGFVLNIKFRINSDFTSKFVSDKCEKDYVRTHWNKFQVSSNKH